MAGKNSDGTTINSTVHYLFMFLLFAGTLVSLLLVMVFNNQIRDFEDGESLIKTKGNQAIFSN